MQRPKTVETLVANSLWAYVIILKDACKYKELRFRKSIETWWLEFAGTPMSFVFQLKNNNTLCEEYCVDFHMFLYDKEPPD